MFTKTINLTKFATIFQPILYTIWNRKLGGGRAKLSSCGWNWKMVAPRLIVATPGQVQRPLGIPGRPAAGSNVHNLASGFRCFFAFTREPRLLIIFSTRGIWSLNPREWKRYKSEVVIVTRFWSKQGGSEQLVHLVSFGKITSYIFFLWVFWKNFD